MALGVVDWREELENFQERYDAFGNNGCGHDILREEVRSLLHLGLLVVKSKDKVSYVLDMFESDDSDFALVQDTPDTIQGVLSKDVTHHFCISAGTKARKVRVSSIMDRKICIEPESASIREVMERMTKGACACTVVVTTTGLPKFIVSPKQLFFTLTESVPDVISITPRLRAQGMI